MQWLWDVEDCQGYENKRTLKFLGSLFEESNRLGWLTAAERQRMQAHYQRYSTAKEFQKKPVILSIHEVDPGFLTLCEACLGKDSLQAHLWAQSLRLPLADSLYLQKDLIDVLLDLSEKHFNLPVVTQVSPVRLALASQVGVEYAQVLAQSLQDLESLHGQMARYWGSDLPVPLDSLPEGSLDSDQFEELDGVDLTFFPMHRMDTCFLQMKHHHKQLLWVLEKMLAWFTPPTSEYPRTLVDLFAQSFSEFEALQMVGGVSLVGFERKRFRAARLCHEMNRCLFSLVEYFSTQLDLKALEIPSGLETSQNRVFVAKLMSSGISFVRATERAERLNQHMVRNELQAEDFLLAEFQRVDKELTQEQFDFLKSLMPSSVWVSSNGAASKMRLMKKLGSVKAAASTLAVGLSLSGFFLSSCGVKKQPLNDLMDPRPQVPRMNPEDVPEVKPHEQNE